MCSAFAIIVAAAVRSGGLWGHWEDDTATPTFVYTADQSALPQAAEPPNHWPDKSPDTTARGLREHSFHLGNDRVTLVGSNYGTWRLRSDESGPKIMTDSDVDDTSGFTFGGGLLAQW